MHTHCDTCTHTHTHTHTHNAVHCLHVCVCVCQSGCACMWNMGFSLLHACFLPKIQCAHKHTHTTSNLLLGRLVLIVTSSEFPWANLEWSNCQQQRMLVDTPCCEEHVDEQINWNIEKNAWARLGLNKGREWYVPIACEHFTNGSKHLCTHPCPLMHTHNYN